MAQIQSSEADGRSYTASLTNQHANTLQWVELIGMPTLEATSTDRALITSTQKPLNRWNRGRERDRERQRERERERERDGGVQKHRAEK